MPGEDMRRDGMEMSPRLHGKPALPHLRVMRGPMEVRYGELSRAKKVVSKLREVSDWVGFSVTSLCPENPALA